MSNHHRHHYSGARMLGAAVGTAIGSAYVTSHAQAQQPSNPPLEPATRPKPAMVAFNPWGYICPYMICWCMIPCIVVRMCGKYEEKKNWNIERMGEDFDECMYFKKSCLCCCVLFCDCCCNRCCSCIWVSSKELQDKKDKKTKINIAKLEGSMGLVVCKESMTPQQYEAYLISKKQVESDAIKAAEKPPNSRSVRDIKLMIVQSMIDNGETNDALELLKDLDKINDSEIENFRNENPASLRTKGLRLVAGVLQVVSVVVPVAGAGAMAVGFAADYSEKRDKSSTKSSQRSDSPPPPAKNQSQQSLEIAVAVSTPPEIVADPSYQEFLEYQKFMKSKGVVECVDTTQNPMIQSPELRTVN